MKRISRGSVWPQSRRPRSSIIVALLLFAAISAALLLGCGFREWDNPFVLGSLEVVSVYPKNGATDVPVNVAITATFSGDVDAGTLNESTFKLTKGEEAVGGTINYDETSNTATLSPTEELERNSKYSVTISEGVKGTDGRELKEAVRWSFTTEDFDTTPPTVEILNPPDGAKAVGVVDVFGTASDDRRLSAVQVRIDEGKWDLATGTSDWIYIWDTSAVMPGPHTIEVKAIDGSNNSQTAQVKVTVSNTAIPPAVEILSPSDSSVVAGTITISGTTSPGTSSVAIVEISIDGEAWVQAAGTDNWSYNWNTKTVENGSHTIVVRAVDTSGVIKTTSITVNVNNDTTPPSVTITSPLNSVEVVGSITISGTASDDREVAGVHIRIDSGNWSPAVGTTNWTYLWSTASVGNGNHTISARSSDSSGNLSPEVSITVIVNNPLDAFESDNSWGSAKLITVDGGFQTHLIDPAGDEDWLSFSATSGIQYTIITDNLTGGCDTVLELYDTNGTTKREENNDIVAGNPRSRIIWVAPADGTYYIKVYDFYPTTGGPGVGYDIAVISGGGASDPYEPNDTYASAKSIAVGSNQSHLIYSNTDIDWVKFFAVAGLKYTITTSNLTGGCDTYIELYDTDGTTKLEENDNKGAGPNSEIKRWQSPSSGIYFIKIYDKNGTGGLSVGYTIAVAQVN
ncbi:MAG: Ig-like domain-containing protein [bacterium]